LQIFFSLLTSSLKVVDIFPCPHASCNTSADICRSACCLAQSFLYIFIESVSRCEFKLLKK
jgi:hypothetical protein